jgi:hypothetical protein
MIALPRVVPRRLCPPAAMTRYCRPPVTYVHWCRLAAGRQIGAPELDAVLYIEGSNVIVHSGRDKETRPLPVPIGPPKSARP